MRWEDFEQVNKLTGVTHQQPRVTILTRGRLNLNKAAYQGMGSPQAIVWLFDLERRLFGLRPASPAVSYSYPVGTFTHKRDHYVVTAKALCDRCGVDLSWSRSFDARIVSGVQIKRNGGEVETAERVLIFPLEQGVQEGVSTYVFEEFTEKASQGRSASPRVTLLKGGDISFNKAAHKAIGSPEAVTLHYSARHRAVGMRPALRADRDSYPVRSGKTRHNRPASTCFVTAAELISRYGITLTHSLVFRPQILDGGFFFRLDKGTPVTPNRFVAGRPRGTLKIDNTEKWLDQAIREYQDHFNKTGTQLSAERFAEKLGIGRKTLSRYLGVRLLTWPMFKALAVSQK